jgi:hypothetical protein
MKQSDGNCCAVWPRSVKWVLIGAGHCASCCVVPLCAVAYMARGECFRVRPQVPLQKHCGCSLTFVPQLLHALPVTDKHAVRADRSAFPPQAPCQQPPSALQRSPSGWTPPCTRTPPALAHSVCCSPQCATWGVSPSAAPRGRGSGRSAAARGTWTPRGWSSPRGTWPSCGAPRRGSLGATCGSSRSRGR